MSPIEYFEGAKTIMAAQILAICIFVGMFLLIILDKFERYYITLASGALVLALVMSLLNVILFFYGDLIQRIRDFRRRQQWKRNWK